MLRYSEVQIGGRPISCRRCPQPAVPPPLSAEDARAAVRESAATARGALALVGDDAFAREDWASLVTDAIAAGVTHLRVDGGSSLLAGGTASAALDAGVRHVRFRALDAHSPSGGGSESLAAIRGFVESARSRGIKAVATALVPVCRHNLHDTPATVTELAAAGASQVTLAVADTTLPVGPAAPWLVAAADSGTINRVWVRIEGFPVEAAAGYELHFTEPFELGGGL